MTEETERLYERALALAPEARAAFVEEACRGDPHLRDELVSLLKHADAAEEFFDLLGGAVFSPSAGIGGEDPRDGTSDGSLSDSAPSGPKSDSMVGRTIGRYRILSRIGSGGMGTVYRAHDARLNREVALKFLPPHLGAEPDAEERLLVEARAAAALEHPNVCVVHEIGETDDGRPFIAMALYEGETLKQRLRRGPLPIEEAVAIAVQIARGLEAAHARGIIHRDVKPANVMLTPGGTVKLLDFGLAKVADVTLTRPGTTPGTIAYMSPEQACGDRLDRRTDLWSLGVVLYEMLAGARPFRGGSDLAFLHTILHEDPEPVTTRRPDAPAPLARIVARLLRKSPNDRYASADELLADLSNALDAGDPARRPSATAWRRRALLAGAGLLIVVAALVAYVATARRTDRSAGGPLSGPPSLAVLPFEDVGGDTANAYLGDGIADEIATALSKAGGLRVASRTSASAYRASHDADVRELGRRLGVTTVLEGRVRRSGDRMRLTVQLTSVSDGLALWSEAYEREVRDVFRVQDEIAQSVAGALRARLPGSAEAYPGRPVSSPGTANSEAYDLYLRATYLLERRGVGTAVKYFERAIAADSAFARAYAGLAYALELMPAFGGTPARAVERRATEAARRALALDPTLAQAYTALGLGHMYAYRWREAGEALRRAVTVDPGYAPGQYHYGHYLMRVGRVADAEEPCRRARNADPLSGTASEMLAYVLSLLGRSDESLAESRRAYELDSSLVVVHSVLPVAMLHDGRPAEARALARTALPLPFNGLAAYVLGATGDRAGAAAVVRELEARPQGEWQVARALTWAYLGLGDTARALSALEDAARTGEASGIALVDPMFDPVRRSARFAAAVRRLGLDERLFTAPTERR